MKSTLAVIVVATVVTAPTHGQVRESRSSDYLFLTAGSDVRAAWVNPAGLAAVPEASIMGEIVVGRSPNDDLHFDQYTVGFNSRGFSVAYQRDRFRNAPSSNILRLSTGLPFSKGSIGVAASWYGVEGPNERDLDVGIIFRPNAVSALGLTLRHIGRPELAGTKLPLVLDGGAGLGLLGGRIYVAGEATGVERLNDSGWDLSYTAGTYVLIPTPRPISVIAVADFDSDLQPVRLNIGFAIGGRNSVTAVATIVDAVSGPEFDRISVAGVASNVLGQ